MRHLPALILGFILIASQGRSAPPSEADIAARLEEVTKERARLEIELQAVRSHPSGSIEAEVHGLMKKDQNGYYILTRIEKGAELRVWLQAHTEEQQEKLHDLTNKEVVATGQVFQHDHELVYSAATSMRLRTPNVTKVPPRGLYFRNAKVRAEAPDAQPDGLPRLLK